MSSLLASPHNDENWLLGRLKPDLRERLPTDLEAALTEIATQRQWRSHPVDIRLSVPLFFRRYYLALVAGPERRSPARRAVDRRERPLGSLGNVAFVLALVAVFYAVILGTAYSLALMLE